MNTSKRYRIEKWLWVVMTAAVVVAYLAVPKWWEQTSILYLAVVSNYALVISAAAAQEAAKAKEESK